MEVEDLGNSDETVQNCNVPHDESCIDNAEKKDTDIIQKKKKKNFMIKIRRKRLTLDDLTEWNHLRIFHPPKFHLSYNNVRFTRFKAVRQVINYFINFKPEIDYSSLINETLILNKIKYRENTRLRGSKVFTFAPRIRKCVENLIRLDIVEIMEAYISKVNWSEIFDETVKNSHLPSKELMEYPLVKVASAMKLLHELLSYCENGFSYCMQYMRVGHMIPIYLVMTSTISRIWALCKAILLKIREWFQNLFRFCKKLNRKNTIWIKGDIWRDLFLPISETESFKTVKSEDISNLAIAANHNTSITPLLKQEEDLGEAIDRKSFDDNLQENDKKTMKRKFDEIKTANDSTQEVIDLNPKRKKKIKKKLKKSKSNGSAQTSSSGNQQIKNANANNKNLKKSAKWRKRKSKK